MKIMKRCSNIITCSYKSYEVTITAECGYKSDTILKINLKYTRFFIKQFMLLIGWTIAVFSSLDHISSEENKEVHVVAT